jgi:hypothetical protein
MIGGALPEIIYYPLLIMKEGIDGRMRTLEQTLRVGWRKTAEEARESIPSKNCHL